MKIKGDILARKLHMKNHMKKKIIIIIAIIIIAGFSTLALKYGKRRYTLVGMRIPSTSLTKDDGTIFSFKSLRGKVVFFMAGDNGCMACRQFIDKVEKTLVPVFKQDVSFVYLDTNEKTGIPSYPEFISLKPNKKFAKKLWVRTIPATYIIDKRGIIRVWEIGNEPGLIEEELLDTLKTLTKKGGV